jgi:hypothetical protein
MGIVLPRAARGGVSLDADGGENGKGNRERRQERKVPAFMQGGERGTWCVRLCLSMLMHQHHQDSNGYPKPN